MLPFADVKLISGITYFPDNGYFSNDVYGELIVTGWIPFLDATESNGCMQVYKGNHSV